MSNVVKFIIPLFALAFLLVSCSSTPPATNNPSSGNMNNSKVEAAREMYSTELSGKHTVVLRTSKGDITIELDADAAPKTVTNFVALAKAGYYDNLTFHRVIPDFMVQAGDPSGNGTGGESIYGEMFEDEINAESYNLHTYKLKDQPNADELPPEFANLSIKEFYERQGYQFNDKLKSLPMKRGAIAMANGGPNTNGSQFFIVQAESTPWLEGRHTVFGQVKSGMEVVDAIANVARDTNDKPRSAVTFTVEVKN